MRLDGYAPLARPYRDVNRRSCFTRLMNDVCREIDASLRPQLRPSLLCLWRQRFANSRLAARQSLGR